MKCKSLKISSIAMLLLTLLISPMVVNADGEIRATLYIQDKVYTVGDPITLILSVNHPAGYQVIFPNLESNWGDFVIVSNSLPETITNKDGTETTSREIEARLFAPGSFTTPVLELTVSDPDGNLFEVSTPPSNVNVNSVLVEGDNQLRDIKPQAVIPYFNFAPWIIISLIFMVVGGGFVYLIRNNKNKRQLAFVDSRSPHEVALDELNRIEGLHLPDEGQFKEHYTLTADCIRLYLEKIYRMAFLERTTYEIQSNLKGLNLPSALKNQIIAFLTDSDLVKFSEFTPDIDGAYEIVVRGRQIVEITKSELDDLDLDGQDLKGNTSGIEKKSNKNTKEFYPRVEVTT